MLILSLVTFVGALFLDLLYVWWIRGVADGKAIAASLASGVFAVVSSVVTVLFVERIELIPVATIGHMAGTYLGVRFKRD